MNKFFSVRNSDTNWKAPVTPGDHKTTFTKASKKTWDSLLPEYLYLAQCYKIRKRPLAPRFYRGKEEVGFCIQYLNFSKEAL